MEVAVDGFAAAASVETPAGAASGDGVSRDSSRALELLDELTSRVSEEFLVLMPNLLSALRHQDPIVVKQSIASGTNLFGAVLEEIALQLRNCGKVEGWLEEMWSWLMNFKDAICGILAEPRSIGIKVLAIKFVEIYVLRLLPEDNSDRSVTSEGFGSFFNLLQLARCPFLDPTVIENDADRALNLLLDAFKLAATLRGSLVIALVNSLAAIARNRPLRYNLILSVLLAFNPNFESLTGHGASIRYSLKIIFLGFLRFNHPMITESREKLFRALRTWSPGESTDQLIRQVEKMSRATERVSRDIRTVKDEPSAFQLSGSGDAIRKRPPLHLSDSISDDLLLKRSRFNALVPASMECEQKVDDHDEGTNIVPSDSSPLNGGLTPAEKMIAMIGALLAEGERGVESLELLISNIHADLLADIVIETMKHLPETPIPLTSWHGKISPNPHNSPPRSLPLSGSATSATALLQSFSTEPASTTIGSSGTSTVMDDAPSSTNILPDAKRDPRRDPRRLDPRRAVPPVVIPSLSLNTDNDNDGHPGPDNLPSKSSPTPEVIKVEHIPISSVSKVYVETSEGSIDHTVVDSSSEIPMILDDSIKAEPCLDLDASASLNHSKLGAIDIEIASSTPSAIAVDGDDDITLESDEHVTSSSQALISETSCQDLPNFLQNVQFSDEQIQILHKLAVSQIIEDQKRKNALVHDNIRLHLLARMVAQLDAGDDIVKLLQQQIVFDCPQQKGHELAMHILYHLHSIMAMELDENSSSAATASYEKFLLAISKAALESLPASDKLFSRLLVDSPHLPKSTLKLLEDLCQSHGYDQNLRDTRHGDRVTQGLGALWNIILGRPSYRQACLDIALKCTLHPQDEVRTKATRLVTNKLYTLKYASESIEQFATTMLSSIVDPQVPDVEIRQAYTIEQQIEVAGQETSISNSGTLEPSASTSDLIKDTQNPLGKYSHVSFPQAQLQMSLFFALCSKKTSLLQIVFEKYGRAPKTAKQAIHRHIPNVIRNLASSYAELLHIISDPPEGSENLIMLVLQTLFEESTPSVDLISAVKHLYETKLKDAAILIPMLSSLSKDEVLPIFPRLVDLPMEKFQAALARILQGSAHSGPALTPAEVLIAIHDIKPERDGVPLKKITDACTACFEQRTVFTQQVLAKSLSHLVDQVPLPLLFMRTVIQAIDAFPTLVDFVMSILLKLVTKQIWKMPKLWVGFLKCAAQTTPHSFHVLLQLPPQQLESVLNKYPNLFNPLAAHANQLQIRNSLPRPILKVLGLWNEAQHAPNSAVVTTLQSAETSSSVQGATPS